MLHASINIFADNRNALLALIRRVERLVENGETDHRSDLYPDGGLHFVLVGEAEEPEPLTEGQLVVVLSRQGQPAEPPGLAEPGETLGQVIRQGSEGATILLSNGEMTTLPDWRDRVVAVTYGAYIDARQEEFLALERLVADRYDTAQ